LSVVVTPSGGLSVKKFRGDRVRFKSPEHAAAYRAAYSDVDDSRVFTVLGREEWESSPIRLRVDAPPFYVWPRDVVLSWGSKAERLDALRAAGHTA